MFKVIIATFLFMGSLSAASLKIGDKLEAHSLRGDIRIICTGDTNRGSISVRCSDSYLLPSMRSKFTADVDADKVKLTFINSKGKKKSKSSRFKNGESKRRFNLWMWSLTQRPMLKTGMNNISYTLSKKGEIVDTGEFSVNVEQQPLRTCAYDTYYSSGSADCNNPSLVCDRYFRDHNYCR